MIPKFRGKTVKGIWVKGYVSVVSNPKVGVKPGTYISNSAGMPFAFEVRPDTVGQSTGFKDVSASLIFEGDIVKHYWSDQVGESHCHVVDIRNPFDYSIDESMYINYADEIEIIGNIHDNPELLKGR